MEDPKTKMTKDTPYELLKDDEKKQLGKSNEAKMTLYNALPHSEYERVFTCNTAKKIEAPYMHKVHKKRRALEFRALSLVTPRKAKVTVIEQCKDLATLSLDELIDNLKVYEMILEYNGIASKTTKENVKSLALKTKFTREQTSDDSDSQGGSDEDVDEDKAEAFNLMARNFRKFFRKGNQFGRGNQFGNKDNKFKRGHSNGFGNRGTKNSRQKRGCYNCEEKGHFISECLNPKENRAFVGRAWSDSEEDNEPQKDATYLMEIDSQEVLSKLSSSNNDFDIIDLKKDNEELLTFSKDFSKTYEKLLQEKRALEKEHSKLFSKVNELELEVINLAKFKE
ncbi:protein CHUP1, chloroplastic [Tanacetum coccineum]